MQYNNPKDTQELLKIFYSDKYGFDEEMEETNMEKLLETIDAGLCNAYKVIDGDHDTLCVVERESGKHFEIKVKEVDE